MGRETLQNIRMSKRLRAMVAGTLLALAMAGCGEEGFPYTAKEMTDAEIECDAEFVGDVLEGTRRPSVAEDGTRYADNTECLREKLPELSDEQIENIWDTIEQARDAERDDE